MKRTKKEDDLETWLKDHKLLKIKDILIKNDYDSLDKLRCYPPTDEDCKNMGMSIFLKNKLLTDLNEETQKKGRKRLKKLSASTSSLIKRAKDKCILWNNFSWDISTKNNIKSLWEDLLKLFKNKETETNGHSFKFDLPNKNHREDYYHERFEIILRYLLEKLELSHEIESDLAKKLGRKKGQESVTDIRIIFGMNIILDIEMKAFWNPKTSSNNNILPWDTLPSSNANNAAKGLLQIHDRACELFEDENKSIEFLYAILSDCVKCHFIKIERQREELVMHITNAFTLSRISNNEMLTIDFPKEVPEGFIHLVSFLNFLSLKLKANAIYKTYTPDHKFRKIKIYNEITKIQMKYHLLGELGKSNSSIVYAAFSSNTKNVVSVKIVWNDKPSLNNEVEILNLLRGCKGIPNILFYGKTCDDYLALVTDVVGVSLDKIGETLNEKQMYYVLEQVLLILHQIHKRKVIHCDVKPSNIIVSLNGIFIIDFGSSYVLSKEWNGRTTIMFASPHVLSGGTPEVIDDLISLFNSFVYLKTRYLPWGSNPNPKNLMKSYRKQRQIEQPKLLEMHFNTWKLINTLVPSVN